MIQSILTAVSSVAGLLLIAAGVYAGWRYVAVRSRGVDIEAGGAANATWQQVHEANVARIEQLEYDVHDLKEQNRQHVKENAELRGKFDLLEHYSAPEAITRFEEQQGVIIEILQCIQKSFESLESSVR
jgi:hypothetical protein